MGCPMGCPLVVPWLSDGCPIFGPTAVAMVALLALPPHISFPRGGGCGGYGGCGGCDGCGGGAGGASGAGGGGAREEGGRA